MWVEMVGRKPVAWRHKQIRPGQRIQVTEQEFAELQRQFPEQFMDLEVLTARRRRGEPEIMPVVEPEAPGVVEEIIPQVTHVVDRVAVEEHAVPQMPRAEELVQIHGIGASIAAVFGQHGILTLEDLAMATDGDLEGIQPDLTGTGTERMHAWRQEAADILGL